jgi:hypothetical protein
MRKEVVERQRSCIGVPMQHTFAEAGCLRPDVRLLDHFRIEADAVDLTRLTDEVGECDRVGSGPTAEVEHPVPYLHSRTHTVADATTAAAAAEISEGQETIDPSDIHVPMDHATRRTAGALLRVDRATAIA